MVSGTAEKGGGATAAILVPSAEDRTAPVCTMCGRTGAEGDLVRRQQQSILSESPPHTVQKATGSVRAGRSPQLDLLHNFELIQSTALSKSTYTVDIYYILSLRRHRFLKQTTAPFFRTDLRLLFCFCAAPRPALALVGQRCV